MHKVAGSGSVLTGDGTRPKKEKEIYFSSLHLIGTEECNPEEPQTAVKQLPSVKSMAEATSFRIFLTRRVHLL